MEDSILLNTNSNAGSNYDYPVKPIAEVITNGFFTVDQKWTVLYWNKAAEKLLGVEAKDIVGKNLWEKFAGIIPLDFYAVYHKAFQEGVPVHFEEYWGEMGAWFDVIAYYSDDKLSVSFKSSKLPETPEQPADQEIKQKSLNELYKFVTEVTRHCLWEWNLQSGEIFWIDGGHKKIFGYNVENALIPQSFWESRIHPEEKAGLLARLKKTLADGSKTWEDEYRFQKADGHYAFVHDRAQIIYDESNAPYRMIGATEDISPRVVIENSLTRERVSKIREITNAMLSAQETERADIGKELHDNLNQVLAVAKMHIQMAKADDANRETNLQKSCDLIVIVIEEIRRIAKNLVVPAIHIIGLFDNIKNLLADLRKINTIKIEFHSAGIDEAELDEKLQINIFRIVQEQLNNIFKHSKASYAIINLTRQQDTITLLISDNGEGYNMANEKKGVGIINIHSRAELYGGNVIIVSAPGEGYELKVEFPLHK